MLGLPGIEGMSAGLAVPETSGNVAMVARVMGFHPVRRSGIASTRNGKRRPVGVIE